MWLCPGCQSGYSPTKHQQGQGQLSPLQTQEGGCQPSSSQLSSILAAAPPQEQKDLLGTHLFPLIKKVSPEHSDMAGKITGWLLERENTEILHLIENENMLKVKLKEFPLPAAPQLSPFFKESSRPS